jgi:hypothetical protein
MAGFDNGTLQGGVFFQAKQFGAILRGFGPPVPQAGVVGDLYIDNDEWELFAKRFSDAGGNVDPWGHYLFTVPLAYRTSLKWFSSTAPSDDVGLPGDYCLLWAGWANYGMQASVYGPKQANGWPENGNGGSVPIVSAGVAQVGIADEGPTAALSNSTQLIAVGLLDGYVLPIPVDAAVGTQVNQQGLRSGPARIAVTVNPLYGATDSYTVT